MNNIDGFNKLIDDKIIPLYDKQSLCSKLIADGYDLYNIDGTIIVGKPCGDDLIFMFGFKDGFLDDRDLLPLFTEKWNSIDGVIWGTMESHSEIFYENNTYPGVSQKEFMKGISRLIGESLYHKDLPDVKNTKDCKDFLSKHQPMMFNPKRNKKLKWGSIEFREFIDEHENVYTIVTYKNKVISHYDFSCTGDYE